jgi:hypothetical protein
MTHWHLDDGAHCEIVNFIDDYSRAALASVAVTTATATDVVRIFFQAAATYGLPASLLSDNGAIYTAAYRGAATGLEIELAALGITFKHGKPYHPQTQGKIERYHRTLKAYLRRRAPAATLTELQTQLDHFVHLYNEERPHQARGRPPMHAWRNLDKATPTLAGQPLRPNTKVRHDKVDITGCVTLRHRSRLHHIGIGRPHQGRRVLVLVCNLDIRVIATDNGEQLRHLTLDPNRDYQNRSRDTV